MVFNPKGLGGAAPKVEWADLEDDVAVLTVASFEESDIEDAEKSGGMRHTAFLTFAELGEKRLYLGVRQGEALVHHFGDDPHAWIGKQVPVEKLKRKFGNNTFEKVVVIEDPDEWENYVAVSKRRTPRTPVPARATVKGSRKRGRR